MALVVGVVDGDTIDVEIDGEPFRLRYIGMDTPETHSGVECLGPQASAANSDLVGGQEVVLERDVSEVDQFGRLLRYVWLRDGDGWLMVNVELVRLGFAQVATYPPDVRYADSELLDAQRDAVAAGRGLWGATCATPAPQPTPSPTPVPTARPATPRPATPPPAPPPSNCDPSYPDVCIPPPPPDLDCGQISYRRFTVLAPDPHGFDGDFDGIGCESG